MRVRVIIDGQSLPRSVAALLDRRLKQVPAQFFQQIVWWRRPKGSSQEKTAAPASIIQDDSRKQAVLGDTEFDRVLFLSGNVLLHDGWWRVYELATDASFLTHTGYGVKADSQRLIELDWFVVNQQHSDFIELKRGSAERAAASSSELNIPAELVRYCDDVPLSQVRELHRRPWYNMAAPLVKSWEADLEHADAALLAEVERDIQEGLVRPSLRLATGSNRVNYRRGDIISDIDGKFVIPEIKPDPAWSATLRSRRILLSNSISCELRHFNKNPKRYILGFLRRAIRLVARKAKRIVLRSLKIAYKIARKMWHFCVALMRRTPHYVIRAIKSRVQARLRSVSNV